MAVPIESSFSTFDVQDVTFFWLLFLGTVQARREWGDILRIFFFLNIIILPSGILFSSLLSVSLMVDLSDSALLPLKKLSVHLQYSYGRCWIRDLMLVPALEGYKSISPGALLNPFQ